MQLPEKVINGIGFVLFSLMLYGFYQGLYVAPSEAMQGEVYRIIYLHVPSAASCFLAAFILLGLSILGLVQKNEGMLQKQVACVEVGLLFTIITLITGSVWGRPTWGTWWTWDARLTTTLLLGVLYAGFRILYNSLEPGRKRVITCSILGIIIAADVPIIYKSVTWWRTLHQPPSIIRSGGDVLSPEIRSILTFSLVATTTFTIWLIYKRSRNIALRNQIEEQSYSEWNA
ncbi:cytochrome c biogenesis protein CcsA [Oligoflexaceae bacterium]|nr:cytochrome c biogenesis protein CcsA [Oligoflexaceae bacterium]